MRSLGPDLKGLRRVDPDSLSSNDFANLKEYEKDKVKTTENELELQQKNGKGKSAMYMLLKNEKIILGKGISLGDNSNEIHAHSQLLHDLNI
jgi:hypothetical protein